MARRYPLDALLQLREHETDARAAEVGDQVRAREAAATALERAQAARDEEQRAQDALRTQELARLREGEGRVADLAAGAAWAQGAHTRLQAHVGEEQRARDELEERQAAEERSRAELARAEAERAAVDRHERGWRRGEADRVEQQSEEEAIEVWQAQRGRGS